MIRRRRLRASENLRALVRETSVSASDLIYPVFVIEGKDIKNPIDSMPGIYQYSIDRLDEELDRIREAGVKGVLLFGIPAHKDECGTRQKTTSHCSLGNRMRQTPCWHMYLMHLLRRSRSLRGWRKNTISS